MPFCPNCHSEYEDWVDTCADCNVPLAKTPPPPGEAGRGSVPPAHRDFVRSMFRPLGASFPSQQQGQITPPPKGEARWGSEHPYNTHPQPLPAGGEITPREQGRNRRLRERFVAPFHPPAVIPTAPLQASLPADTVLPVALDFDLHHSRSTYDPAGDAWVVLITAPNEIMANIVRSQLADAGVPALIKLNAAVDNGQFINNSWVARDIWVQARDVERARDVVDFYHNGSPITDGGQSEAAADGATAGEGGSFNEMERSPQSELPWLPTTHYEDPDMAAANASVDEYGRPRHNQYVNPMQRPWFRWLSFVLLLAWAAPYLLELLGQIGQNIMKIFR